jgi:flagellar hook-basal body complex protein FliE
MNSTIAQAAAAYKNIASMQTGAGGSSSSASLLQQTPQLPGEEATRFQPDFEDLVAQGLDRARDAGYVGESESAKSMANKAEYHELVTAVNNADLTLRTVVSIRDRMVSAYQDVLKMPI